MNKCSFYFNCSLLVDLCQSFWNVARHLEIRLPVSGLACYPPCHPERRSRSPERSEGEGSGSTNAEILREARDDKHYLQMSILSRGSGPGEDNRCIITMEKLAEGFHENMTGVNICVWDCRCPILRGRVARLILAIPLG